MNREDASESREDQAVAWFVRLQDCDDEAVWIAHRDWLEADPANAVVYDAVEGLWIDADALATPSAAPAPLIAGAGQVEDRGEVIDLAARRGTLNRRRVAIWFPAAAAAVVAMIAGSQLGGLFGNAGTTYRTNASSEQVALADGSIMTLNRSSEATVRIDGEQRSVTLASGEASFDVEHDLGRPFTIEAGGREVRVLGTAFDVLNRNGTFGVSVARGVVSVSSPGVPGGTVKLPAGKALLRLAGSDGDRIDTIDPDNASAWKDGRLVYLDSDLGAVARDYERYVGRRVVVAPDVASLHISGVIKAGNEDDLIQQLEQLLPVRVIRTAEGRKIIRR